MTGRFFEQHYALVCSGCFLLGTILTFVIWSRRNPIHWKLIDLLWISYAGAAIVTGLLYVNYLNFDKDVDFYVVDNQRAVKDIQAFSRLFYAEECEGKLDDIYYHFQAHKDLNTAMELSRFENTPPFRIVFCIKMYFYLQSAIEHAIVMQGYGFTWGDKLPQLKHTDTFMGLDIKQLLPNGAYQTDIGGVLVEKNALIESKVRQYNFGIDAINKLMKTGPNIVFGRYLRPFFLPLFFLLLPLRIGKSVYDISTTSNASNSKITLINRLRNLFSLKRDEVP